MIVHMRVHKHASDEENRSRDRSKNCKRAFTSTHLLRLSAEMDV
jgi:hypothetical protein